METRWENMPYSVRSASSSQSGQVAVVVLLIMAVLLVLGLSLASRTTQEALISSQEEDTTRVFNAAETAVEEALSKLSKGEAITEGLPIGVSTSNLPDSTSATYTLTAETTLSGTITQGMSATVFLTDTSPFTIHWGSASDCNNNASLIVSLYYSSGGTTKVKHLPLKPIGCYSDGSKAIGFTEGVSDTGTYRNKYVISSFAAAPWQLVAGEVPQIMRIKALYKDAEFGISGITLPSQKDVVRAEASDSKVEGGSQEKRAIEVTRTKPAPPAIFDYSLYSGGSLNK